MSLLQNSDLTTEYKKSYLVFKICRIGTNMDDTMFVNLVAKTLNGDGGYYEGIPCAINQSGDDN